MLKNITITLLLLFARANGMERFKKEKTYFSCSRPYEINPFMEKLIRLKIITIEEMQKNKQSYFSLLPKDITKIISICVDQQIFE
jgi:hypothetical protein